MKRDVTLECSAASGSSVVARVRRLLEGMGTETTLEPAPRGAFRNVRGARQDEATRRDLDEIESRLDRLRARFPDMAGVEVGPLVSRARTWLGAASPRMRGPGEAPQTGGIRH